jgi:hypothetical protein
MTEIPEQCGHGVPFRPDQECVKCDLVRHRELLKWAERDVKRHRAIIAQLERSDR